MVAPTRAAGWWGKQVFAVGTRLLTLGMAHAIGRPHWVSSASVERVVFLAAAVVVGRDGGVMVEGRSEVGRTVSRLGRRSRGARGGRCPGREARDRGQSHRVVKG